MVPSVGPVKAAELLRKYDTARNVFSQNKIQLQKAEKIGPSTADFIAQPVWIEKAAGELAFLKKHRINVHYIKDSEYPGRLKACNDAPLLLFTKGEEGLYCKRSLSVVGTRRATSYGRALCSQLIQGLASQVEDLVIVSGLAYGIDVMAHRAALEAGIPTVAVLGHGFSTLYPPAHRDVARQIIRKGALVTDFHSFTGPERNNFLRRNRIIAGLSDATLVIESAETGGALITAELAKGYNRDVLAVPGRVTDIRSKGCNRLIKRCAAAMVETADDILYHLNWNPDHPAAEPYGDNPPNLGKEEGKLLQLMREEPGLAPDLLSQRSELPLHRVLSLLVEMELKRLVMVEPGNRYHPRIIP